jgi:Fe2+ or Zn2+ uptake regulation protein
MNIPDILTSALRTQGHKLTRNRIAILSFLSTQNKPIAAEEILEHIQSEHQEVHKTTIYRELIFLLEKKFIQEVEFGDGKKRYEIAINRPHHHHVICLNCKRVEDIPLEKELLSQEKLIEDLTKYRLTEHMLEFFGLCENCK